ncbi:MAG: hypothetical protein ACJ76F_12935 [Bacteroidia bacterium]
MLLLLNYYGLILISRYPSGITFSKSKQVFKTELHERKKQQKNKAEISPNISTKIAGGMAGS